MMSPGTRPILWINAARKEFDAFPAGARLDCAMALTIAAAGAIAGVAKPMRGLGSGGFEIALPFEGNAVMKTEPLEITRGSGNLFRDLGYENADALQLKALLAAQIIKTLDREALSVRKAQERTGIAAADFSRIRNGDLKRFTLDRLMGIVNKLGSRVEVSFRIKPMANYPAGKQPGRSGTTPPGSIAMG